MPQALGDAPRCACGIEFDPKRMLLVLNMTNATLRPLLAGCGWQTPIFLSASSKICPSTNTTGYVTCCYNPSLRAVCKVQGPLSFPFMLLSNLELQMWRVYVIAGDLAAQLYMTAVPI